MRLRLALALWFSTVWNYPVQTLAKDTGEFADVPGAREWFQGAAQKVCCSEADGHRAIARRSDFGWEVQVDGQWIVVAPNSVIKEPSPFPDPVVWYYRDAAGAVKVRCLALNWGL